MKGSLFIVGVVVASLLYVSVSNWMDGIRDWRLATALQKSQAFKEVTLSIPSAEQAKHEALGEIDKAICFSMATLVGMILMGSGWTWICRSKRAANRLAGGICIRCAYDLTGNVSGVCPECGTAVNTSN